MTLPRIYSPESLQTATTCELGADNLRYLKTVLRLKPGDDLIIFDGFGHEFAARIQDFAAAGVNISLGAPIARTVEKIRLTLAQAIPKAGKMDGIVKTAAELGADVIIPFTAARSLGRIAGEKAEARVGRWRKIVREAARCSRSPRLAVVEPISPFDDMLALAPPCACKMIFWEEEDRLTIRDALQDQRFSRVRHYFIIVGPEGGLSREEVARAEAAGFASVSLGRRILKVETAAAAIISIIQYEKGIFSESAKGGET